MESAECRKRGEWKMYSMWKMNSIEKFFFFFWGGGGGGGGGRRP